MKLDVVSRLIFEPIVCCSRYWNIFVRLTPAGKLQNSNWERPEMDSHWRWRDTIILHKEDTTHSEPRRKKGATKHVPLSKHSHFCGQEAETWGRKVKLLWMIQQSSSTSHAPIAPHVGLQSLNSLLLYFYKFELTHNAYIWESKHKIGK